MKISIYRFNPDQDTKPYMQSYDFEPSKTDVMLLDALINLITSSLLINENVMSGRVYVVRMQ